MSVSGKKTKRTTADKVPPTGKWVQRTPHAGSTVSGTMYLEILAVDNRAMNYVIFYVNGVAAGEGSLLSETARGGVYSLAVDTRAFENGSYNVSAYLNALEGPGMTKNLGTITIENSSRPSAAIVNVENMASVTLPLTVEIQVSGLTSGYTVALDGDGSVEAEPTDLGGGLWRFVIDTWYDEPGEKDRVVLTPTVRLDAGGPWVTGQSITVLKSDFYGSVSVTYALSGTTLDVGDTLTVTPTITGDSTDLSIVYNFDSDSTFETVPQAVGDAVTFVYQTPGTYSPSVRVERNSSVLQLDSLGPVTVSVAAGDTTPPTISVSSPANGATVSGTLSYSFDVSDAVGATLVVPLLNGAQQGQIQITPASTLTTVTASVDTTTYPDGALTIAGTAYDSAGNSTTSADVVVTIDNVPLPPPPPPSADWYDWATERPFTSMTETRRNITGSTVAKAPISFMVSFHPGEIPTTKTLQLRDPSNNIVPTTHWQFDSRVTYPDGSLSKAWVRVLGPASLAHTASVTYTVEAISGSWPAETNTRTITDVTEATDFWIELDDIRLIGKPQASSDQNPYTNPTLEFRLNNALNVPQRTRKDIAGPLVTGWYTRDKLRPPGGGTGDAEMHAECWVRVWRDPDTGTILHRSVHPLIYNGYARVLSFAKAFKLRAMNGVTVLRNYATTLDRTVADFDMVSDGGNRRTFTSNATDFTTFDFRQGSAVKISGSPPSGIQNGKIYAVSKYNGGTDSGRLAELTQNPYLSLQNLHNYDGIANFRTGAIYDPVNPGTGGGTFTMTGYTLMFDQQVCAVRDGDAKNFWLTGGGELTPYWTRAEKIRRFQTGHLITIPVDEVNTFFGVFEGLSGNAPKNTTTIPVHNHKHRYTPGIALYHRNLMEASGEWYQGGRHLNEISVQAFDVLNDMANPNIPWDRILRMTAAEGICFQRLNCAESQEDSNGNPYAHPIIVNNGPNKNGAAYPNCGPCWPTAQALNAGSGATGIRAPASGSGNSPGGQQENEMGHWAVGGDSGSHGSKDFVWTYAFYGDPSDLRAIQSQYTRHMVAQNNGVGPYSGAPLYGKTKTYNGTTYYCVSIIGTSPANQPRAHIGKNHMLAHALLTPDNDPLGQYFKDIAADNVNFLEAIYDDNTIFGTRARTLGPMMSLVNGGQQTWQVQRIAIAGLMLLKRSGIVAPKTLKYLTAFSRWMVGHPDFGPGSKQAQGGFTGCVLGIAAMSWFDNNLDTQDPTSSDPRATIVRFLDAAAHDTDAATQLHGASTENSMFFLTSSEIQMQSTRAPAQPENDDQILFVTSTNGAIPAGVSYKTRYWLYDRTLVSGTTYKYKLSSTPGPSYTRVTWTIGSNLFVNQNNVQVYFQNKRVGDAAGSASGLWQIESISAAYRDYLNNTTAPLNVGYTMFGPAFQKLSDAAAAFKTYEDALVSEIGKNFWDRAKSFGSWCMHKNYGPGYDT